jgi:PAS domain S-box-containing protein/putative nucleotidyltransferase with HDIG domain
LPGIIYQFYAKDSGEYGMSYASERLKEIFGIEASADALFPLFLSHVHEEDRESFLISIKKAVEAESTWNFEARVFTRDDKMIWFQGIATPTRHEDQQVFNGILLDITERKQAEVKLQELLESLRKAFAATIQVMVSAVEMRDPYTAGHQARTADIARAIATEMGLDQDKIDGIRMAGTIHDIGKLSIPAEILSKPTKLTNLEFSLIKEHPKIGYEILKDIESPWPLAEIVYQHHERMDGSGYPRKLKGDAIIMEARIMAVADVVEAMASHRPYRAALGIEVALEEIEKNKGTFYDNTVAEACLRLFRNKGYKLPN